MTAQRALGTAAATLAVVAAVALACWFAFALTTGATLVTFRTGSMAPSMPQGSLAVTLPVAAPEIAVGDVVTVRRASDGQPVTHRVVEVRDPAAASSELPLAADQRELVLKGDDNDGVDMRPYVVSEARRVVLAIPKAGAVLVVVQSPIGMGILVLLAGALTAWSFWPRRPDPDPPAPGRARHAATSGAVS